MAQSFQSYKNHFLVAARPEGSRSEFFDGSVVYIGEHTPKGALGFVINRPAAKEAEDAVKSILTDGEPQRARFSVFAGGPVEPGRVFVLHRPKEFYASSVTFGENTMMTTDKDAVLEIAGKKDPKDFFALCGYSGWFPGQLEKEIEAPDFWLVGRADESILFDVPPEKRRGAVLSMMGITEDELNQWNGSGACA